jgi:toxin YoeB
VRLIVSEQAWADYLHWQAVDRKMLARINDLLKDCTRSPAAGIGKPEPLRGPLSGWWSRRITQEHRLVYRASPEGLLIAQCRYHY